MPGARILLVDDDPPLLKLMRTYLTHRGYDVEACGSSDEALRVWREDPGAYAVAVLDNTLNGMSGEALARCILADNPGVRIILASGYPTDVSAVDASGAARVTFLQKPFAPEALAAQIKRFLES